MPAAVSARPGLFPDTADTKCGDYFFSIDFPGLTFFPKKYIG